MKAYRITNYNNPASFDWHGLKQLLPLPLNIPSSYFCDRYFPLIKVLLYVAIFVDINLSLFLITIPFQARLIQVRVTITYKSNIKNILIILFVYHFQIWIYFLFLLTVKATLKETVKATLTKDQIDQYWNNSDPFSFNLRQF